MWSAARPRARGPNPPPRPSQGVTAVRYLTHDALLADIGRDPLLTGCGAVAVDGADSRALRVDATLALLKAVSRRRPDLRIVLLCDDAGEAGRLADWWGRGTGVAGAAPSPGAALISVSPPPFPVRVQYLTAPAPSYVSAAADAVRSLHAAGVPGDVGVAAPTPAAAAAIAAALRADLPPPHKGRSLVVLVLAGDGDDDDAAAAALAPPRADARRAVVVADDGAGGGLATTPLINLAAVVDTMLTTRAGVGAGDGVPWRRVAPISAAEAAARAARAGRRRPGVCVRLATEEAAGVLEERPPAGVGAADLAPTLLRLKALGVDAPLALPWPTRPPPAAVAAGLESLFALGAVDAGGRLTPAGARMAELPLPPRLARALLAGGDAGVGGAVATVCALAGVRSIFSAAAARAAGFPLEAAVASFAASEGDPLTWLNVWRAWDAAGRRGAFASAAGLDQRALLRAADVRAQLLAHAVRVGVPVGDADAPLVYGAGDAVARALAAGLFAAAARSVGPAPGGGPEEYEPLAPCDGGVPARLRLVRPSVLAGAAPPPRFILVGDHAPPTPDADDAWTGVRWAMAVDADALRGVAPHYFA